MSHFKGFKYPIEKLPIKNYNKDVPFYSSDEHIVERIENLITRDNYHGWNITKYRKHISFVKDPIDLNKTWLLQIGFNEETNGWEIVYLGNNQKESVDLETHKSLEKCYKKVLEYIDYVNMAGSI